MRGGRQTQTKVCLAGPAAGSCNPPSKASNTLESNPPSPGTACPPLPDFQAQAFVSCLHTSFILSHALRDAQKQTVSQIWTVGHSLPTTD